MSEQPKHTPGYVRVVKWDEDESEAQVLTGLSSPDADDFVCGLYMLFRNEADAREWAHRWNCHESLRAENARLAACLQRTDDNMEAAERSLYLKINELEAANERLAAQLASERRRADYAVAACDQARDQRNKLADELEGACAICCGTARDMLGATHCVACDRDRLREALEPLAGLGRRWAENGFNTDGLRDDCPLPHSGALTMGDARRAAEVYARTGGTA